MMISIYITLYNNILHFCRNMDPYVHLCMWSIHSICIQFLNRSLPTYFLSNLPTLQLSLVVFWIGLLGWFDACWCQSGPDKKDGEMYEFLVPNTPINVCAAACLADGSNKPHLKTTQHHQHIRFVWSLQINLKWVAWNRCFKKYETVHTISNLKLEFFRNFSTLCCVVTNIPQNEILLQFAIQKIVSVPDENQE